MNSIETNNMWYFRAVTDEDDDDYTGDSVMLPVDQITGIAPQGSTISIFFKGNNLSQTPSTLTRNKIISLTYTAGYGKEVCEHLASLANAGPHHGGVTVVADDVTTDFDGTTRDAIYSHKYINGVHSIRNA